MPSRPGMGQTDWETLGRDDPYFAVLSDPRFHRGALDEAAREQFFRSGREHVDDVLRTMRERIDPTFSPSRVLDFGCGVGRVVIPLASACPTVVGVDVSASMLAEAQRNCDREGLTNVELVEADDRLSRVVGTFDLIHSYIVFQHIPPRRGMPILAELMGRLEPGGVGVLHFTFAHSTPAWVRFIAEVRRWVPFANALINVIRRRPASYPLTQMHQYDLGKVHAQLARSACDQLFERVTDHQGNLGALLFFQKGPRPPAGMGPWDRAQDRVLDEAERHGGEDDRGLEPAGAADDAPIAQRKSSMRELPTAR